MNPRNEEGVPAEKPAAVETAALADFLRTLAHDLRSPLGVVSEAITELRSDLDANLTDEHRLLVSLADRSLLRLGRIADTLSLLSALDSGRFELRRQPVDLALLAGAAAAKAVALEPRREVELTSELPEGPCRGMADEARLPFAISELVVNAIRHARRRVSVRVERVAGEVRVAIEDDGQGLGDEARATLYQRLVTRQSRSGLGVGLSVARDVIRAHGGRLTLDASTLPPGRPGTVGARFLVTLPVTNEPGTPAP